MRMLDDTRAAINTGIFDFHIWVMFQCPDIVDEFFNVVRILLMTSYIYWLLWISMTSIQMRFTVK